MAEGSLHIAVLVEYYNPRGSGVERSAAQVVDELVRRGHRVTVLCTHGPGDALGGSANPRCVASGLGTFFALGVAYYAHFVGRQVARQRFDVTLSMTPILAGDIVEPRSGTVAQTVRGELAATPAGPRRTLKRLWFAVSPKKNVLRWLERRALRSGRVWRYVALSRLVSRALVEQQRVPADRVVLIANGSVVPGCDDASRDATRRRVREGFGLPRDGLVFLFVATRPRSKGLVPLLHAMRRLLDRGVDAHLIIAGSVAYHQQHLAAHLNLRDRVRIVGPTKRVAPLYLAADVTVHPSYHDPASKIVVESLMLRTPVITTAFDGASELVLGDGHDARGRVVPNPDDVEALCQAMADLSDPAERTRCAAATAGLADALHMARHVDELEQLVREAAERPTAATGPQGPPPAG